MNKILTFAAGVVIGVVYKDGILQAAKQIQSAKDAKLDKKLEDKLNSHFKEVAQEAGKKLEDKIPGAFENERSMNDLF